MKRSARMRAILLCRPEITIRLSTNESGQWIATSFCPQSDILDRHIVEFKGNDAPPCKWYINDGRNVYSRDYCVNQSKNGNVIIECVSFTETSEKGLNDQQIEDIMEYIDSVPVDT
jgi:hypothetical protein